MGETGVGKSTWINGFANCLYSLTLDEASKNAIFPIPASFMLTDKSFQQQIISTGIDKNEKPGDGQSSTQYPKTFVFRQDDFTLRVIDTPGMGDTAGIDKDKENFQNILTHIARLDKLHGICILLKPNNSRLTALFEYCIKELLTNLHKNACRNIIFCFTNSRSTFYHPGDTMAPLLKLLRDNQINIALNKDTVYSVDNEAIRYLAAITNSMQYNQTERQLFNTSWITTMKEEDRLLKYVSSIPAHEVQHTLSINNARHMIWNLTKPLAELTHTIQQNLCAIDIARADLLASKDSKEIIAKNLHMPKFDTQSVPLDKPLKVCKSETCVRLESYENATKTIYACSRPTNRLFRGKRFGGLKRKPCSTCGCSRSAHDVITYQTVTIEKNAIDPDVLVKLIDKEAAIRAADNHLQTLKELERELEAEQKQITEASAQFACFLKKNAITPYNDSMDEYLLYIIKNKKKNENASAVDNGALESLNSVRKKYIEQVSTLEMAMRSSSVTAMTPDEVMNCIEALYVMKHAGPKLKNVATVIKDVEHKAVKDMEVEVKPKKGGRAISILQKLSLSQK